MQKFSERKIYESDFNENFVLKNNNDNKQSNNNTTKASRCNKIGQLFLGGSKLIKQAAPQL